MSGKKSNSAGLRAWYQSPAGAAHREKMRAGMLAYHARVRKALES